MGKAKKERAAKRNRFNPLVVGASERSAAEPNNSADSLTSTGGINVLKNFLHTDEEERRQAARTVSHLVLESKDNRDQLLANGAAQGLISLLKDPSQPVRSEAVGAMRNLTLMDSGGPSYADTLIQLGVLENLNLVIQEALTVALPADEDGKVAISQYIENTISLLWNLAEESTQATQFAASGNIPHILAAKLDLANTPVDLAITAAQCLCVLSDSNDEFVAQLRTFPNFLQGLMTIVGTASLPILLRVLAAGLALDLSATDPSVDQAAAAVFRSALEFDSFAMLGKLVAKLDEQNAINTSMPSELEKKELPVVKMFRTNVNAQTLALEYLTNLLTFDDGSDNEMADSDAQAPPHIQALFADGELYRLALGKAVHDVKFPTQNPMVTNLARLLDIVQWRALSFLNNIIVNMSPGRDILVALWPQLFAFVRSLGKGHTLETATMLMVAILETTELQEIDIKPALAREQLQELVNALGAGNMDAKVWANCVTMVGCLAPTFLPDPNMNTAVGQVLLAALNSSADDVLVEAIHAVFSVFGEKDLDAVFGDFKILDKLKTLVPVLQRKVKQTSHEDAGGREFFRLDEANDNLSRFIQYKQTGQ